MANETYYTIAANYMAAITNGEMRVDEAEAEIGEKYAGNLQTDIKRQLQRLMSPGLSIGSGRTRNRKTHNNWKPRRR